MAENAKAAAANTQRSPSISMYCALQIANDRLRGRQADWSGRSSEGPPESSNSASRTKVLDALVAIEDTRVATGCNGFFEGRP